MITIEEALASGHGVWRSSDCIEWHGYKNPQGYGRTSYRGKKILVHRRQWIIERGPIPDGLFICHHCDNPSCYNIDHLFIGTRKDNTDDMVAKGRHMATRARENHPFAKLNWKQITEIKQLYESGKYTHRQLGHKYEVHHSTIGYALREKTWSPA